jgi:large subunit ribosomal protein L13Ae
MFKKEVIIDAKDHLKGRLASYVAKLLLNGQKVVIVRCENVNISGSLFRNKLKYKAFKHKKCLTNPKRGPLHLRFPSKVMWRAIRGMMPHKT